jgi:uncharacterized membrane protein YqjE
MNHSPSPSASASSSGRSSAVPGRKSPVTPAPTGFLGSLQQLGDGLLAALQGRIQLFSAELQEEKLRLIQSFAWISAAIFAGAMALAFASLTFVYSMNGYARLAALAGLTLLYAGGFIAIVVMFRRHLARQPRPFADTLDELTTDRSCFRPKN